MPSWPVLPPVCVSSLAFGEWRPADTLAVPFRSQAVRHLFSLVIRE